MFLLRFLWRVVLVGLVLWLMVTGSPAASLIWSVFMGYCIIVAWPSFWRRFRVVWNFPRPVSGGKHFGRLRGETL